ncbi:response regulator [Piscinibacter sakaiensis]|uniref:Response regulator n=2 Tax=Piscinibacter sakaiensis TaxID=1547922 RepID=A0A0K8P6H5_PISS1|nr:response regulator [Piscinibacter sakaiensis]
MEPLSGLATFSRLRALGNAWPVLFLTGHGDVGMAVAAVKAGAMDFLEKPFQNNQLVDKVEAALAFARSDAAYRAEAERFRRAYQQLSTRERDVMKLLLEGHYNKNIGDALGIAPRTVEFHRANVFLKMGVSKAVELAHKLGRYRVEELLVPGDWQG